MKKIKFALALSIMVSFLAGCGNGVPDDWKFAKEDVDNFMIADSELLRVENSDDKIIRVTQAELLNEKPNKDDFFVFDFNALNKVEKVDGYHTYEDYRNVRVNVIKTEYNHDDYTLDVYFEGSDEGIYGAIFNKDATVNDGFLLTVPGDNALNNEQEKKIDKFESLLLDAPIVGADKNGYIDIVDHFGKLVGNLPLDEKEGGVPNSWDKFVKWLEECGWNLWDFWGVVLAVVGIVLQIAQWIWSALRSDFYDNLVNFNQLNTRVNQIDGKLNKISANLTSNFSQLLLRGDFEEIRSCTTNIGLFKTGYTIPINNFLLNLSDNLTGMVKNNVEEGKIDISISFFGVENVFVPISNILSKGTPVAIRKDEVIQLTKSSKYFNEKGAIDKKFGENFLQDVRDSVKGHNPDGFTEDNYVYCVVLMIIEAYISKILSDPDNFENLSKIRNLIINYLKQFYTVDLDIISKYVNRCKLTYNFGYEAQKAIKSTLASLMFEAKRNAALAQAICRYSKDVDELDLQEAYINATSAIKAAYESIKNIPTNYCFRTETKWETKLFRFNDNVVINNKDTEYSGFSHSLKTELISPNPNASGWDKVLGKFTTYDRNTHPWADSIALRSVTARYLALKGPDGIGNISLLQYFHKIPGLINRESNQMLGAYYKYWGKEYINRFMGDFSTRFADEARDQGRDIVCVARGDKPHGSWFALNWHYKYIGPNPGMRKKTLKECWKNGTYYTVDMFDAETGEFKSQQDFIFYCDYLMYKSGWKRAENWAFSGGIVIKDRGYYTFNFGLGIELS